MSVFWGHLILKLDERKKTALSLAFFHSWSSVDYAVGLPCTSHGPVGTKLGVFEHTLPSTHQYGCFQVNFFYNLAKICIGQRFKVSLHKQETL